jgi:hypothetical protein
MRGLILFRRERMKKFFSSCFSGFDGGEAGVSYPDHN